MKNLLRIIVNTIGWRRALAMVWDLCDDGIKEHVKATPEKWDDEAIRILDATIKQITTTHQGA